MLVKLISDLHTEMWNFNKFDRLFERKVPPCSTDEDTVVCVAGDLGVFSHYSSSIKPALNYLSKRFKGVVYVYGNHEWYNSRLWGGENRIWNDKRKPENVHILQDDYIIVEDVVFIGATLWTSFNNSDPIAMFHASRNMSDYECIRFEIDSNPQMYGSVRPRRVTPEDTVKRHMDSKKFIFDACKLFKDKKKIVVTHHCPSELSVHSRYKGDLLNYAYFSDLSNELIDYGPDIWHHGHTHDSFDYILGNTRVICNPLGYHCSSENKKFNPDLLLEV